MLRHFVDDAGQGECLDMQISCWDMAWVNHVQEVHAALEVRDRELPATCDVLSGSSY